MSRESYFRGRMHADLGFPPDIGPRHRDRDFEEYRHAYDGRREEMAEERRAEQRARERRRQEEEHAAQAAQEQENYEQEALEAQCGEAGHPVAYIAVPADVLREPDGWPRDVCHCGVQRYEPTLPEPGDTGLESIEIG